MQEIKRVLSLQVDKTFRRPRSWNVHTRYAILSGGQKVIVRAGAWLLELGPSLLWTGSDRPETEHLYRLAAGEVVALERSLVEGEAAEIDDQQAVTAMNAFRTPEEAILQDWGIALETECRHLPPFALIKCPLCGGVEFTSIDLASAWCNGCTTQFTVRSTGGDFGFVVDARWSQYSYLSARYIMPRCDILYLCLVLKDSQDPRDMTHDPEGACWSAAREGKCRPDAPWLTGGDMGLRPGLHQCMVGTLYDWKLLGRVPTPEELGDESWMGWKIDNRRWPNCATTQALSLETEERRRLEQSAGRRQGIYNPKPGDLDGQLSSIGRKPPMLFRAYLPSISSLREDEYYLLHHWVTTEMKQYRDVQVWPVWYVVRPATDEHGRVEEWDVVRRNICPQCSKPVVPADLDEEESERLDISHSFCRDVWERTEWRPQFDEARVGE